MGKMLNQDEVAVIAALLKTLNVTEVFIPRDTLSEAYGGLLYIEDDFQRNGWTIRLGDR